MRPFKIVDLFCGAGGSSTGAKEAAEILGYSPELTVVNHWDRAIETHKLNHPDARHFCTGVDNINPRELFEEDELSALLASPECMHHSNARGGRPVNEQSRATAMCVIRWLEALRPPVFIVENVPEFRGWGPLIRKRVKPAFPSFLSWMEINFGEDDKPPKNAEKRYAKEKSEHAKEAAELQWVPDPARKGELFRAWVNMIEASGYRVEYRVICCADYGDPTTRKRLFILGARGRRRVFWPNPTHLENPEQDLFKAKSWIPARDIIDWGLPGVSIYDRKKPLSPKTMERIWAGLEKFGLKAFMVPGYNERDGQQPRTHDVNKPVPTVAATGHTHLAEPFLVPAQSGKKRVRSVDKPLQTVTTEARGIGLAEPFLVKLRGTNDAASIDKPMPTVTGSGNNLYVAEPFVVQSDQTGSNGSCVRPIDKPLATIITKQNLGLVEPFLVQSSHGNASNEHTPNNRRAKSIRKPLGAVTGSNEWALTEPYLVQLSHGDKKGKSRGARSVGKPLPTICGQRGDWAVCEPHILGQQSGSVMRPVTQPVPTIATDGAVALIEPVLIQYNGKSKAQSVNEALGTVTTRERFGLAEPIMLRDASGSEFMLDIRYRMLQPHELSLAQGFRRDYKFTGTKTEIVKMIGNAVPRCTLRALLLALQAQRNDITDLVKEDKCRAA